MPPRSSRSPTANPARQTQSPNRSLAHVALVADRRKGYRQKPRLRPMLSTVATVLDDPERVTAVDDLRYYGCEVAQAVLLRQADQQPPIARFPGLRMATDGSGWLVLPRPSGRPAGRQNLFPVGRKG